MKRTFLILIAGMMMLKGYTQTAEADTALATTPAVVDTEIDSTEHEIIGDKPDVKVAGDTTNIKLGTRKVTIIEKNGKTTVQIEGNEEIKEEKHIESKNDEWDFEKEIEKEFGDDKKADRPKKFKPHFAGFELFINSYVDKNGNMSLKGANDFMELNTSKSWYFGINIFEYGIPVTTTQGFVTGLGFEFNDYHFDKQNNIQENANGIIVAKPLPSGASSYEKTKFGATYLNIPLLYEVQFPLGNAKRPLYFSVGFIGGFKLTSSSNEIYTIDGKEVDEETDDDFNLSPFRYGVQARLGFRRIHLFTTVSFSPLFQKDKGPELYPFNVGLVLLNF